MKAIYVRKLTEKEEKQLKQQLQSGSAFTVRRCQILLSSAQKKKASQIAQQLHCSDQCVREAIHAFEQEGLNCLSEKSHARHDDQQPFDEAGLERLQEIIRLSPRSFGHDTSVWSLALLAETCWAEKISHRQLSGKSVGRALKRVGIQWRRAKHWQRSPDPHYEHRKQRRDSLKAHGLSQPDWLVLEQDECWFSRFSQTALHTWSAAQEPQRLVQREPQRKEADKALACFGAVCQNSGQRYFYFGQGQPNTDKIILMLERFLAIARYQGKRVLLIFWDRASWHQSKKLYRWIRTHNQHAKLTGDVRLLTVLLPSKSPWLNSMEPHWLHAKRKVAEFDGKLSVAMLKRRLCAHFQVPLVEALLQ